jgi:hypothetical protein
MRPSRGFFVAKRSNSSNRIIRSEDAALPSIA